MKLRLFPAAARDFIVPVLTAGVALTFTGPLRGEGGEPALAPSASIAPFTPKDSPAGVCQRMFVIGASASNGFCIEEIFGGPKTRDLLFSRYLEAALKVPHDPVRTVASRFMFMNLKPLAEFQIAEARKADPSLVVAMDFLFWFCYGRVESEETRLSRLEEGLKMLESLSCPLVIGDLPDASAAVGRVLDARQLPKPEVLMAANRRIREWAEARENTVVIPLAEFMEAALKGKPITVRGHTWTAEDARGLLQNDRLHPDTKGCAALAMKVMDALLEKNLPLPGDAVTWDPEAIFNRALQADSMTGAR